MNKLVPVLAAIVGGACGLGLATPLLAQPAVHGRAAAAAVLTAGTYKLDAGHTQVIWSVDHFGFSRLYGMAGQMSGALQLDPARPDQASLQIDIPVSGLTVTSPAFGAHLQTPDLFDAARFPAGRFVSRSVSVKGDQATITGDLTLHGVTRPLVLNARLYGAGINAGNQAQSVGFSATGTLKRSEFGLGYAIPRVSDEVQLQVTALFAKPPA